MSMIFVVMHLEKSRFYGKIMSKAHKNELIVGE